MRRRRGKASDDVSGQPAETSFEAEEVVSRGLLGMVLDGVVVIWVVVIGAQYALMMLLPGAPEISASFPALLAGVVVAGIMRYLAEGKSAP